MAKKRVAIAECNELNPSSLTPMLLFTIIKICGKSCIVLLDSGSSLSIISKAFLNYVQAYRETHILQTGNKHKLEKTAQIGKLKALMEIECEPVTFKTVTGFNQLNKNVILMFNIGNHIIYHGVYVSKSAKRDMILGNDFLRRTKPIINYAEKSIVFTSPCKSSHQLFLDITDAQHQLGNEEEWSVQKSQENKRVNYIMPPLSNRNNRIPVRVRNENNLPSHCYSTLPVYYQEEVACPSDFYLFEFATSVFEKTGLLTADLMVQPQNFAQVPILNCQDHEIRLPTNTLIGYLSKMEEVYTIEQSKSLALPSKRKKKTMGERKLTDEQIATIDINPQLSSDESCALINLLNKYSDCFSFSGNDVGTYDDKNTDNNTVKLETGNHPPISLRPNKFSIIERDIIKTEIQELESRGIIRKSASP